MGKHKKVKEYAMYKGDEFIDVGTIRELAEKHNAKASTLQWYAGSNRYKSLNHYKGGYTIVAIEEDEDETV